VEIGNRHRSANGTVDGRRHGVPGRTLDWRETRCCGTHRRQSGPVCAGIAQCLRHWRYCRL
jgi:hypothetical protein